MVRIDPGTRQRENLEKLMPPKPNSPRVFIFSGVAVGWGLVCSFAAENWGEIAWFDTEEPQREVRGSDTSPQLLDVFGAVRWSDPCLCILVSGLFLSMLGGFRKLKNINRGFLHRFPLNSCNSLYYTNFPAVNLCFKNRTSKIISYFMWKMCTLLNW